MKFDANGGEGKLPGDITAIAGEAFKDCKRLTSVVIPDGVTSICHYTFEGCTSLTSVDIPESVTSIGSSAFSSCSSLQFNEYDNANYLGNESNPYFVLIKANDSNITSCNINETTKMIVGRAFSSCDSLTTVTIPASVVYIGDSVFEYLGDLKTVNYRGTKEQWNAISIGYYNSSLTASTTTINYNYTD
ncbi:leucine-rich repeat domain-containing protein [uncultured Treponema sp.]|uniref:leucine-rich repeat domain-containing protein n=1 Tax=uncultured Treponema sp. TaxID=162155 RepID=UPI00280BA2CA|nr:leucine-rich repeat domain-containing protein [uncultured Treponema sp.]